MRYIYLTITALFISMLTTVSAQELINDSEKRIIDTEYTETKEKLIELHLLELDSESYKRSSMLAKSFNSKLKYTGTATDLMKLFGEHKIIGWIEENLAITSFESVEQAQQEFDAMMRATTATIAENEAYHSLMIQSVMKYGPEILTEVTMHIFREYPEKMGISPNCIAK